MTHHDGPRREPPSRSELQTRLQRVNEALQEAPPHSASGTRERLEAERTRLQRRLQALAEGS